MGSESMIGIGVDIGGTAVKLAAVNREGAVLWAVRSASYSRPSIDQLVGAIRNGAAGRMGASEGTAEFAAGLCVPGLLDDERRSVIRSVNVSALNGVRLDELVAAAFSNRPAALTVTTDAHATAFDLYQTLRPKGRMFTLAIGTGVGACVLDDGQPLRVDGDSPGHFGQIDVSVEGHPVIGPDGGAGSLEGYLSAGALASRFGPDSTDWPTRLRPDDPPLRALARAIRIAHALYRPQHIFLAGGIGTRLTPHIPHLYRTITHQLTHIARPDWTLSPAPTDFHAAQGAARLALQSTAQTA